MPGFWATGACAQTNTPAFKVIAFYTGRHDQAHISFMHEANAWFPKIAQQYNFTYDTTTNWDDLNADFLAKYQVVIFCRHPAGCARPARRFPKIHGERRRLAGISFCRLRADAVEDFTQNWDWHHRTFLGCGQFVGNTWRPTSAVLRVENREHPATRNLPETFRTSPSEWYKWQHDLRTNSDISILLSIDPSSFPLGTGPKAV